MLLPFAQFEREVIGERVRDKIAASKRKGLWVGGPVPLMQILDQQPDRAECKVPGRDCLILRVTARSLSFASTDSNSLLIDDGLLFVGMDFAAIDDFADVEAVLEEVGQRLLSRASRILFHHWPSQGKYHELGEFAISAVNRDSPAMSLRNDFVADRETKTRDFTGCSRAARPFSILAPLRRFPEISSREAMCG